jgi:mRNA interferase RelE/StbE
VSSGGWTVVVDPSAARDLKTLQRHHHPARAAVASALDVLPSDPHAGKPLRGDRRGARSLRVGDFRIIYDLYPRTRTIHVIRIGDRKDVYR